jgi:hypothetical protein
MLKDHPKAAASRAGARFNDRQKRGRAHELASKLAGEVRPSPGIIRDLQDVHDNASAKAGTHRRDAQFDHALTAILTQFFRRTIASLRCNSLIAKALVGMI